MNYTPFSRWGFLDISAAYPQFPKLNLIIALWPGLGLPLEARHQKAGNLKWA